jgi:hypothetical protein
MKKLLYILISLVILTGCEPKISELTPFRGSADFSRYIAVGNSITAGFTDGALYTTGQANSFPNLLAGQFRLAGGGNFIQPVVTSEFGVDFPGSDPRLILGYVTDCRGVTSLGPIPDIGPKEPLGPVGYLVNNLGIPGAKTFHLLVPGYALLNPYYARFATAPTNMLIQEIPLQNATFFSLCIGNNDLLMYAINGGAADSITPEPVFNLSLDAIVAACVGTGTKGVIANIPDITSIPFFTTVPYNGLVLPRQTLVDSVNAAMQLYGLPFTYVLGPNPFLVPDPASPHPLFKVRPMAAGELVLLTVPQDSIKCFGMGLISAITFLPWPIPDKYVLTQNEITAIQTATTAFNQKISDMAALNGLALVDMHTKMQGLQAGIIWDGIRMNTRYVTGGVFSLDGIHLNPRGNAVLANYFIESINAEFGSTIPYVDITKYPGVIFP